VLPGDGLTHHAYAEAAGTDGLGVFLPLLGSWIYIVALPQRDRFGFAGVDAAIELVKGLSDHHGITDTEIVAVPRTWALALYAVMENVCAPSPNVAGENRIFPERSSITGGFVSTLKAAELNCPPHEAAGELPSSVKLTGNDGSAKWKVAPLGGLVIVMQEPGLGVGLGAGTGDGVAVPVGLGLGVWCGRASATAVNERSSPNARAPRVISRIATKP
jgi:hypothetical protein